jgi:hypothetical protein
MGRGMNCERGAVRAARRRAARVSWRRMRGVLCYSPLPLPDILMRLRERGERFEGWGKGETNPFSPLASQPRPARSRPGPIAQPGLPARLTPPGPGLVRASKRPAGGAGAGCGGEAQGRAGHPPPSPSPSRGTSTVGTPAQGSRRTARAPGVRSGHACHSLRGPHVRRAASMCVNVADTTCGEEGGGRRGPPRCGPHHCGAA